MDQGWELVETGAVPVVIGCEEVGSGSVVGSGPDVGIVEGMSAILTWVYCQIVVFVRYIYCGKQR